MFPLPHLDDCKTRKDTNNYKCISQNHGRQNSPNFNGILKVVIVALNPIFSKDQHMKTNQLYIDENSDIFFNSA